MPIGDLLAPKFDTRPPGAIGLPSDARGALHSPFAARIIVGMWPSRRSWLIVVVLVALAGFVVLVWRSKEPLGSGPPSAERGPYFEVEVERPRLARPLFGLLPSALEERLQGGKLRFAHTSPGAEIGTVARDRLELSADGWFLHIETDGDGRVASATSLVFPIELAERHRTLRCRPADGAPGYLRITQLPGSDEVEGSFRLELAICENAETGKVIEWPPAPLTVRGSFVGPPRGPR